MKMENIYLTSKNKELLDSFNDFKLILVEPIDEFFNNLESVYGKYGNKVKYIKEVLEGTVDLRRKKKDEVSAMLLEKGYNVIDEDADFKYLTKLPMDSVSQENVEKLENDHQNKMVELDNVKSTTIQQMWLKELVVLETEYLHYKEIRSRGSSPTKKTAKVLAKVMVKKNKLNVL